MKHCAHGLCNSNSRYCNEERMRGVSFFRFPNPKKEAEKCERWVFACNRENFTVASVNRYTYICSKHFASSSGPTKENPDPVFSTPPHNVNYRTRKKLRITSIENVAKKEFITEPSHKTNIVPSGDEQTSNPLGSALQRGPREDTGLTKLSLCESFSSEGEIHWPQTSSPTATALQHGHSEPSRETSLNSESLCGSSLLHQETVLSDGEIRCSQTISPLGTALQHGRTETNLDTHLTSESLCGSSLLHQETVLSDLETQAKAWFSSLSTFQFPNGWVHYFEENELKLLKIKDERVLATITVTTELQPMFKVFGKQLPSTHPLVKLCSSLVVSSLEDISQVVQASQKWRICPGNKYEIFKDAYLTSVRHMKDCELIMQSSSLHSVQCELLLPNFSKQHLCKKCRLLRDRLVYARRTLQKGAPLKSKTNLKYLALADVRKRIKRYKSRLQDSKRKLARARNKFEKELKRGQSVSDEDSEHFEVIIEQASGFET